MQSYGQIYFNKWWRDGHVDVDINVDVDIDPDIDEHSNNSHSDVIGSPPLTLNIDPNTNNPIGDEDHPCRNDQPNSTSKEQKVPKALSRLLPHNKTGQNEQIIAPEDSRRTRSGKYL